MKIARVGLITFIVAVGSPGFAQQKSSAKPTKPAEKVTNLEFEAETVSGELVRPGEISIRATRNQKHASLIRLREEFVHEIIKTAENR